MMFPKPVRIRDRAYLDYLGTQPCASCGASDGTVVGAHIRAGHEGGTSLKPADDLTLPLCFRCHASQERQPGPMWWLENIVKPMARRMYARWSQS